MRRLTAERLVRRVRQVVGDRPGEAQEWPSGGRLGWARTRWARLAWWRLVRAGGRGDAAAVDALWTWWLADPHARPWTVLDAWRRPASTVPERGPSLVALDTGDTAAVRGVLVTAARRAGHPIAALARARIVRTGDQDLVDELCAAALDDAGTDTATTGTGHGTPTETDAGLAAFCVAHGLAPARPAAQVEFFLLTGQADQYQAVDPDGALLALVYGTAPAARRRRLRAAMAEAGGFDMARLLNQTGRQDLIARMTDDELAYVTQELAGRGEFGELWQLVMDLPLRDALTVMPRFDGTWRPADEDERDLYELLARTDPEPLTSDDATFRPAARISVPGEVVGGALHNNGRRVAVATQAAVHVLAVRQGSRLYRMPVDNTGKEHRVLMEYRGDSLVTTQWRPASGYGQRIRIRSEHLVSADLVTAPDPEVLALARTRRGFVALGSRSLMTFGAHGEPRRHARLAGALGLPAGPTFPCCLVTEPRTGLIAVSYAGALVIVHVSAPNRPLVRGTLPAAATGAVFASPGRLVTTDSGSVRLWALEDGGTLRSHASAEIEGARSPVLVRARGELAVLDGEGRVHYLHAASLVPVRGRRALTGERGTALWGSGNGSHHALGGDSSVAVVSPSRYDAALAVADRPASDIRPADLAVVEAALQDTRLPHPARTLLTLLRAKANLRFSTAIALGTVHEPDDDGRWASLVDDDGTGIALGPAD